VSSRSLTFKHFAHEWPEGLEPRRWDDRIDALRTAVNTEAYCKGIWGVMYPRDERDVVSVLAAKAVCSGVRDHDGEECPVRYECLLLALVTNERDGIWGGATSRERDRMRRVSGIDFGSKL
jgi:hypothetical protein